jgi:hypothetical protein
MFIKLFLLLNLYAQAAASSLRYKAPMTTVIPKPHITVLPTDMIYTPIYRDEALYNLPNHYLR